MEDSMTMSRGPSRKDHPDPEPGKHATLSPSAAAQVVSALVAGEPEAAERLAAVLVLLEADLIDCPHAGPALENARILLEMAYQQSDSYRVSLAAYREDIRERLRKSSAPTELQAPGPSSLEDLEFKALISMMLRQGEKGWRILT
jgi:hypothetical protein